MRCKRIAAFLLAAVLAFGAGAGPVWAAAPQPDGRAATLSVRDPEDAAAGAAENGAVKLPVSVKVQADKGRVYGEPLRLTVATDPADAQYVAVAVGVSGRAKGYVGVQLPERARILLKLIPLPRSMSRGEAADSFTAYQYLKQIIDGREVEELLRAAEEAAVLLEALGYYLPDLAEVGGSLRSAAELAGSYLPDGLATRVYLDETPQDAGRYMVGALTVDSRYERATAVESFSIRQKTEGVWAGWSAEAPASMTAAEAAQFDFGVRVYDGGTAVEDTVECLYTGWSGWRYYRSSEPPTQPGRYTQKAAADGNYKTGSIRRSFAITG